MNRPPATDIPPSAVLPAAEWARRQAASRRTLRRANLAVALALGTVLALAFGAVWQTHRAVRLQAAAELERTRAEAAEAEAGQELRRALLAEAVATRQGARLDRREVTLDILRRAAAMGPSPELRDQAVATLALPEYRLKSRIALDTSTVRFAITPDLDRCALVMPQGDIEIRRFSDGTVEGRLERGLPGIPAEQGPPVLLEFAPEGRRLAVRYAGGAFALWELDTMSLRVHRDTDRVRRLASPPRFSTDGQYLVAPVFEPDGMAVIDAGNGATVAHFPGISSFNHVAVRPGRRQFAAELGSRVAVLDWDNGAVLAEFPFAAGSRALAWSPDGGRLAIAGNALAVEVWDWSTHGVLRLSGHQDAVFSCAFDATGTRLATASFDGISRIWDLRDGRLLAMATDRRLVAWGSAGESAWSVSGQHLEIRREPDGGVLGRWLGLPDESDGVTFDIHPDGLLAWSRDSRGRIWQWDLSRKAGPKPTGLTGVDSFSVDPRGPRLLFTREGRVDAAGIRGPDDPGGVGLEPPTPAEATLDHRVDLVVPSAESAKQAYVFLAAGAVWVGSGTTGSPPVRVEGLLHSSVDRRSGSCWGTGTIALSPDGRWFVCGADGISGTHVFDAGTGATVTRLDDDTGGVQFSPDGQWVVLASVHACRVYETGGWTRAWAQAADAQHPNYSAVAAWAPDGSRLAYAESTRTVALLEAGTWRRLATLESPSGSPLVAMRWSADGRRLVGLTRDHAVEVWKFPALQEALAGLGLGWDQAPVGPPTGGARAGRTAPSYPTWVAVAVLITAGWVAVIAMMSLRRHRKLLEDYGRAEELAARRERELALERDISQLKSSFVAMVSHEFRTPLGITMSAVELLRNYLDRLSPGKKTELLEDIYRSTRHMSSLMEQVLLLGRAESGRLGCRLAPLDLPALVERLLDEARSATDHRCVLRFETHGSWDGARGDESLLAHALSNLVSNAVKYSARGQEVVVEARRDGADAVLVVRDRGIGIPAGDQARLFEAFHRGTNVGQTPGTGLGLLIVKRCIDLHGGRIEVHSQEGQGTAFTVRVPLFQSAGVPALPAEVG